MFDINSTSLYEAMALLLVRCVRWKRVEMEYTYDDVDRTGTSLANMRISRYQHNYIAKPETFTKLVRNIDALRSGLQCYIAVLFFRVVGLLKLKEPVPEVLCNMDDVLVRISELETIITQNDDRTKKKYPEILGFIPPLAEKLATEYPGTSAYLKLIYNHALLFEKLHLSTLSLFEELNTKHNTLESALDLALEAKRVTRNNIICGTKGMRKIIVKVYTPEELEDWTKTKAEGILRLRYIVTSYAPDVTIEDIRRLKAFEIWSKAERKSGCVSK